MSTADILIIPVSSISITAPVSSVNDLIVAPPFPITSLTLSDLTCIVTNLGAFSETSFLEDWITLFISPKIWILPSLAWASAIFIISSVIPLIFISIWRAVTPSLVPATLKSISPRWSSSPNISDKTTKSLPSLIKPIAIPATGATIGTPASIRDKLEPHTLAIELDPFDSVISETTLITYGNSSGDGNTGTIALFANFPWPISLLFGDPTNPVSPTEYGGKL